MWNCEESQVVRKSVNAQFAGQRNGLLTEAIKQEVLWSSMILQECCRPLRESYGSPVTHFSRGKCYNQ